MLRALKWAYDLGVRQERVRIASHLNLATQSQRLQRDTGFEMMREQPKMSKNRKQRLEFMQAVNQEVEQIIHDIMEPRGEWTPGPSLMFPNDKHKGEK